MNSVKKEKRIIVLIDRYLPVIGGAQRNVHELSGRLTTMGFKVTVLTRRLVREMSPHEELDSVSVLRLGYSPIRILSKISCFLQIIYYLLKNRKNYDLILCVPCVEFTDLLPAYLSSRLTQHPYVIRLTGIPEFISPNKGHLQISQFLPFVWKGAMKEAAAVVAQSQVLQQSLSTSGVRHIEIISNGIDTRRFRVRSHEERLALKNSLDIPADKITVINTGRIAKGKNLITLVRAVDQLENGKLPGKLFLLILVGKEPGVEDPAETELREYIEQHNLSHMVSIRENVDSVEDYLSASDIFVLPTYYNEGMSNSGVEAMASGLPMVCSELPQVTITFPPGTGLFFPATDVNALSGYLEELAESTDKREDYGQQLARFATTNYSNEVLAKRYADLFCSLIAASRKTSGSDESNNI